MSNLTVFTKLKDNYGWTAEFTPMDEIRTVTPTRLAGATYEGNSIDANFWTSSASGTSAEVSQYSGSCVLISGTIYTGTTSLQSVRTARYTGGSANRFRGQISMDDGVTGNTRQWGCFNVNDGAYFELCGTTMNTVTLKNGIATKVPSTSWNANTTLPTYTNVNVYEIYYTNGKVYYVIGGVLKHTFSATTNTWSSTKNLPIRVTNFNDGGTISKNIMVWVATISRLGELQTDTISKYIATDATTVCKYNAGRLHRIINCDNAGSVTIYDNTAASGTILAIVDTAKVLGSLDFHMNFFNGLTIVTATSAKIVVIYE